MRVALFGGLYSNYLALDAAVQTARSRGVDAMWCLGDLGAFGPHPDRVFPILHEHGVPCLQGNYDDSIGHGLDDCQCGYTDPRDNHFAQISYDYTLAHTSDANRAWLRQLPEQAVVSAHGVRVLLCHGSPRRVNEFVWESNSSTAFLARLCDENAADVICSTHTGLHWHRELPGPIDDPRRERHWVNVGVLGRPANDGRTCVWMTLLQIDRRGRVDIEFVPVGYDHQRLAAEMRAERLPDEFIATVTDGYWTTCLEVLPSRERRAGTH